MSIIKKIIEQQGENSKTVQVMRQFFPVIEKAEAALQSQDRDDGGELDDLIDNEKEQQT